MMGIVQVSRDTLQNGYCTDVCVNESTKGVSHHFGGSAKPTEKVSRDVEYCSDGVAAKNKPRVYPTAIVVEDPWGHGPPNGKRVITKGVISLKEPLESQRMVGFSLFRSHSGDSLRESRRSQQARLHLQHK